MAGHRYQWFGGVTYAQHGEDLIVLNILSRIGVQKPSYLDIGANHPKNINNTALMYERGSRGINVEPDPVQFAMIEEERGLDVNLNVGVAPVAGTMRFYSTREPGRNSFIRELAEPHRIVSELDIPVVTVASIIEKHSGGTFPDFLSLDVEGMDLDVLRSIDFVTSAPKVVCVEVSKADLGNVVACMAEGGFDPCFRAASNMIFLRSDFRGWVVK